jgi:hypothetical protein
VAEAAAKAEAHGALYGDSDENVTKRFANRGQLDNGALTPEAREQDQRKYVGPDGVKFDIVNAAHARNSWRLPV